MRRAPLNVLVVTPEESERIGALVREIESYAGSPFMHDPAACFREPPQHVITPRRVRAIVSKHLHGLTRREELARRFLNELTLNGKPFLELEAEGKS